MALAVGGVVLALADREDVLPPAHAPLSLYLTVLRVVAAAVLLFGATGLPVVRALLPDSLQRHWPLWVLPTGACVSALLLTALGFAGLPLPVALALVLTGAALANVRRWQGRRAWRERPEQHDSIPEPTAQGAARLDRAAVAWGIAVATAIALLALIPLLRSGFATVIGDGSDAHLSAGTAQFLQHDYPTAVDIGQPVNQVPPNWTSKQPIYYAFASVASLSGLPTYQVLSPLAALLYCFALLGFFLLARELLGAGLSAAVAAVGLVGLDRMVLFPVIHPFFNQTWGFALLPFSFVLAWTAVRSRRATPGTRGTLILTAVFLAVLAFAYPLALPIPLIGLAVFAWRARQERKARGERLAPLLGQPTYRVLLVGSSLVLLPVTLPFVLLTLLGRAWRERRRRRAAGEQVPRPDPVGWLRHHPRRLLWVLAAAVFAIPATAVGFKVSSAVAVVVDPSHTLSGWSGGMTAYIPAYQFYATASPVALALAVPPLIAGVVVALRRCPRELAWGLATIMAFGLVFAAIFRARAFGYYFHFKLLAFVAPLIVLTAAVGMARLGTLGVALLALFALTAATAAADELTATTNQLPRTILALKRLDRRLPASSSIRLDMNAPVQIWVAYLLVSHPLCSQRPLLDGSYPHVPVARAADYILVQHGQARPFDALGAPLLFVGEFRLYRERPHTAGPSGCSARRVQVY